MKARQNLRKRARQAALRGEYNPYRASYGPEWERLQLRMGHHPFYDFPPEDMARKVAASAIYGKFGTKNGDT